MSSRSDFAVAILRPVTKKHDLLGPVKTTVELPGSLWRAAKIRAMDERADLRTVFIRALEAYLQVPATTITKRGRSSE